MPLRRAVDELAARGFTDLSKLRHKGRVAVLDAVAPRWERLTLVIDLSTGDISGAFALQLLLRRKNIKQRSPSLSRRRGLV